MGLHSDKWVEKWVKPTRAPSRAASSRMVAFGASVKSFKDRSFFRAVQGFRSRIFILSRQV
ncbi:hypothetical protein HanXRQr2_Chr06g0241081 [Helianthus annuus]|uniref:Uncharacterized protein n=1 Tax=Helianthus annuus TaxID=4232 RepID=A0A251UI20_HELAN|nr:hypothetical protein HanXRQr2_Chr06g0241081 [Helianthus annuus]